MAAEPAPLLHHRPRPVRTGEALPRVDLRPQAGGLLPGDPHRLADTPGPALCPPGALCSREQADCRKPARLPADELPAALETDLRRDHRGRATDVEVRCRLPAADAHWHTARVLRPRRSA